MRITKNLRADQELILRFLDTFSGAAALLSSNRHAKPGFFIFAHSFIHEYIEAGFFKKEDLFIQALEDSGFPSEEGPVGSMRAEQRKSREAAELLIKAAKAWQAGDEAARTEVGWAASEFSSVFRQHLDRLKNLIFPLLEQNLSPEDEHKIAEGLNTLAFEHPTQGETEKYVKLIESLEDELSDWK